MSINYDDDPDFVWKRVGRGSETKDTNQKPGKDKEQPVGGKKRKRDETDSEHPNKTDIVRPAPKKRKTTTRLQMFRGLKWNPRTQSCAYDSVLSVISNVYLHNARNWQESMGGINSLLSGVIQEWAKAIQYAEFNKMEAARDALQAKLNSEDSISFPISGGHTDLGHLLAKLMRDDSGTQWKYARKCGHCNREETPLIKRSMCTLAATGTQTTLAAEIKHRFNRVSTQPCRTCRQVKVSETLKINKDNPPPFMAIQLEDRRQQGEGACQPKMTSQVTIGDGSDKLTYKLRGLIYWNRTHFTCRMVGKAGQVYYNDGMTTGNSCIHEGKLGEIPDMYNTKGAQLTYVILSLV